MTGSTTISRDPGRVAHVLVPLIDRLVLVLFWTCLVVSATVLVEAFRPVVVIPLLLVTLLVTWRAMPGPFPVTRRNTTGTVTALVLTAVWVLVHLPHAAEYVTVTRDPGFLTLEGLWLADHADPELPQGTAAQVAEAVPGAEAWDMAYFLQDGELYVQGAKLLPGLLGLLGWVGGDQAVLVGNLLAGAFALLALYGLGRRVVGPLWALVPVVAFGTSVPLAAFSRAAYTEPLTVALGFGGLTMAWSALGTRTWWRLPVAGAMVGSPALVRIDGAASVTGFVVGLALVAAAALRPDRRRSLQIGLITATLTALAVVGLGYLDLRLHSPGYLNDLGSQFTLLVAALVGSVVVSLGLVVPPWWDPARRWLLLHRRTAGLVLAAVVPVAGVVLVSRPLWLIGHRTPPGSAVSGLVTGLQAREGLPVEPTRSYDEMSVAWIAWYHGWPLVVLAFAGLALMTYGAVRRRDPRLFVVVAVVAAPSLLYLWRVSITPDQVWAVRRLLPVTIPGFLLAATVVLAALWSTRRRWLRALSGALAVVVALFPLTTWGSLFTVVEQGGRWGQLEAVCSALPHDRVVYVRPGGPPYLASLRTACDVEVVELPSPPTTQELARLSAAWDGQPLAVVAFNPEALPWPDGAAPDPFLRSLVTSWGQALSHLPAEGVASPSDVWIAELTPDGGLVPVPPHGAPAG